MLDFCGEKEIELFNVTVYTDEMTILMSDLVFQERQKDRADCLCGYIWK